MSVFAISAIAVLLFMILFFLIAQLKKDNSIVDIGWGLGFLVVSLSLLFATESPDLPDYIITGMIAVWGLRLAIHIFLRSKGRGEDFRYAQWRKEWGKKAVFNAFYRVFMLQGAIMYVVAFPIIIVFSSKSSNLGVINLFGVLIFAAGFLFEAIADMQLYCFKRNEVNKGKIITSGLWKYTRHPNYFGEALLWWGIALFTYGTDLFLAAFISPVVINLLLRYLSGVPMLEKKYEGRKDWEEYKRKTPPFIPRFRKSN